MSNNKATPETLLAALSLIERGVVRPTLIAKGLGISYRSYTSWMLRSNRDATDPAFLVEYAGETMSWAKAIGLATRLFYLELRGSVLQYSLLGLDEVTTDHGQVVWQLDRQTVGWTPAEREALGFRPDGLAVGPDNLPMPVTVHRPAPIQLRLRVLEMAFKDFRPGVVQEVTVNGSVAIGIATRPAATYTNAPPPLIAEPAVPQVEFTEGEFTEALPMAPVVINIVQEDDLSDLLDGPVVDEPSAEIEMVSQPTPEPAPTAREERSPVQTRWGNLTEAQAAVLEKLKTGIPTNAPTAPATVADPRYGNLSPQQAATLAQLQSGTKV
jgi:hypothetical protein